MTRRDILRLFSVTLLGCKAMGNTAAFAFSSSDIEKTRFEFAKGSSVMMGNVSVSITAVTQDRQRAKQAIEAAFTKMKELERLLNFYDSRSEISQINAAAGQYPVAVSSEVMEVISQAMYVSRLTKGAFNLALGPTNTLWDFLKTQHVPSQAERVGLLPSTIFEHIVLDDVAQTVFLTKPKMRIDCGGIGKGFMAEKAKHVLMTYGVSAGIIAAAGDVLLFGNKPNGQGWRVGIQHPRNPDEHIASLDLTDTVVSTSGDYERFFMKDGIMYHHLLDPTTLLPARACQSVTVIGVRGALTDALATGVFVMGPEEGLKLLANASLGEAVIVDERGRTSISPTLEDRVRFL